MNRIIKVKRLKKLNNNFKRLILEDPVRPSIPAIKRIGKNKDIFYCDDNMGNVKAITCVSYNSDIPATEDDLFIETTNPIVAVFYTIWSYVPGMGRDLLNSTLAHILDENKSLRRFVTLSPKTEMARRFHIKNGAIVLRENQLTINYEYLPIIRE